VPFENEREELSSVIQDINPAVLRDVEIESLSRTEKKEPRQKDYRDTNPLSSLPSMKEKEKEKSTTQMTQEKSAAPMEQKEQRTLPTNANAEVHHEPEVTILMMSKGRNPMPPVQTLEPSQNEIKSPAKVEQEDIVHLPHPIMAAPTPLTNSDIMSQISGT
jgi:hypothetical protein